MAGAGGGQATFPIAFSVPFVMHTMHGQSHYLLREATQKPAQLAAYTSTDVLQRNDIGLTWCTGGAWCIRGAAGI